MTLHTPSIGPEGLRLSASQVETFRLCAAKWARSRIHPGRSTPAAQLGSEVHWCMENWTAHGTVPHVAPLVFKPNGAYVSGATDRAVEIANALIPYAPRPGTVDTESEIRIVRSAATYTGRRDYVRPAELDACATFYRHLSPEAQRDVESFTRVLGLALFPIVGDYKTTSNLKWAKTPDELRGDTAANLYAEAEMQAQGTDVCGLEWPYITTTAPYKVRVVRLVVLRADVERVLRQVDDTAHEMRPYHGVPIEDVPRTLTACDAFGGCPYIGECAPTAMQRMGSIMTQSVTAASPSPLAQRLRDSLAGRSSAAPAPAIPAAAVATPEPPAAGQASAPSSGPAPVAVGGLAAKIAERKLREAQAVAATAAASAPAVVHESPATRAEEVRTPAPKPPETIAQAVQHIAEQQAAMVPVTLESDIELRDHIAIAALNGMLARGVMHEPSEEIATVTATRAYLYADAMLQARTR
jgi:hypothetical protein